MNRLTAIWPVVSAFILAIIAASVVQLVQSYDEAVEAAYVRSDLPGYLVSEWITESFANVELVLRESLADFDESTGPTVTRCTKSPSTN